MPPRVVVCPVPDMALADDLAAATNADPVYLPARSRQREADDAVGDFLADALASRGLPDDVAEALVEDARLFRHCTLDRTPRGWTRIAGPLTTPAKDTGTLLLIPPGTHAVVLVRPQADPDATDGCGGLARRIAAEPMRAVLAIVPPGMQFELTTPDAILTSPLRIPPVLAAMLPSRTAPVAEPRDLNACTVRELRDLTRDIMERIDELTLKHDAAAAALDRALRQPRLTATLDRVRQASPRAPFLVILRDSYHPHTDPSRLRGDDALTFNGLVADYPDRAIRLVHIAVHDDTNGEASHMPHRWEDLLADAPGWVDVRDETEAAAVALRGFRAFYGGRDMPGVIESSSFDDHPEGPVLNLRWSVLLVA